MSSTLQTILRLREQGYTWGQIAAFTGEHEEKVRSIYRRRPPEVRGITVAPVPDDSVLQRAISIQRQKAGVETGRNAQRVVIPGTEPFAWAWLSDLHIGDGADYEQLFRDAEIIRDTDRMWCSFNGDACNNWIVGKLAHLQRGQQLSHDDEWRLLEEWLGILGDKLRVVSLGNHELWTFTLAGVNRMKDHLARGGVSILYDDHEVVYDLVLGDSSWRVKQRHAWRWSSIFNPTHGIEVGLQRGDDDFDIGVGGHTHLGTLCRPFYFHGRRRYAVLIGTYSRWGKYGRQLGLPPSKDRGCGAMVFQAGRPPTFLDDLETSARFLSFLGGEHGTGDEL